MTHTLTPLGHRVDYTTHVLNGITLSSATVSNIADNLSIAARGPNPQSSFAKMRDALADLRLYVESQRNRVEALATLLDSYEREDTQQNATCVSGLTRYTIAYGGDTMIATYLLDLSAPAMVSVLPAPFPAGAVLHRVGDYLISNNYPYYYTISSRTWTKMGPAAAWNHFDAATPFETGRAQAEQL